MRKKKRQPKYIQKKPKRRVRPFPVILGSLAAALLVACGIWFLVTGSRTYFRDVTVELGTETLSIRDFLTALSVRASA